MKKLKIRRFFLKNRRLTDCLIAVVVVFLFIGLFSKLPISLGFLNPIGNSIKDFDIYDVVFSKLRNEPPADTNIVLVNIGDLDRAGIAREINIINSCRPKVIGLDLFFLTDKEPEKDLLLKEAISRAKNLVIACKLEKYDPKLDRYDSLACSDKFLGRRTAIGFSNLPEEDNSGYRTIRSFRSYAKYKSSFETAFALKIVEQVDKKYIKTLNKRNYDKELINYTGNLNKYYYLESSDLFSADFNRAILRDKIVLIGFMGIDPQTKTFEDIFFTPINERYAGRTFPDMYGVVINANIISMIMRGNYISVMPQWLSLIIAILMSFSSLLILMQIKKVYRDWFGAVYKLFIFTLTIMNMVIGVYIFNKFSYKINLTLTLVAIVIGPTCLDLYELFLKKKLFPKKKEADEKGTEVSSIAGHDILSDR
ncbi:MAG: CHASE2 domain-containing protein [Bacillota bacterium]